MIASDIGRSSWTTSRPAHLHLSSWSAVHSSKGILRRSFITPENTCARLSLLCWGLCTTTSTSINVTVCLIESMPILQASSMLFLSFVQPPVPLLSCSCFLSGHTVSSELVTPSPTLSAAICCQLIYLQLSSTGDGSCTHGQTTPILTSHCLWHIPCVITWPNWLAGTRDYLWVYCSSNNRLPSLLACTFKLWKLFPPLTPPAAIPT